MSIQDSTVLALDVGSRRIGIAIAHSGLSFASPLCTIEYDDAPSKIQKLIHEHRTERLVVGLPRGLSGQDTQQTVFVRDFVVSLKKATNIPIIYQDEALTSRKAEQELEARGKPYAKGDIDALAATYILEDYMNEHSRDTYA